MVDTTNRLTFVNFQKMPIKAHLNNRSSPAINFSLGLLMVISLLVCFVTDHNVLPWGDLHLNCP